MISPMVAYLAQMSVTPAKIVVRRPRLSPDPLRPSNDHTPSQSLQFIKNASRPWSTLTAVVWRLRRSRLTTISVSLDRCLCTGGAR